MDRRILGEESSGRTGKATRLQDDIQGEIGQGDLGLLQASGILLKVYLSN